MSVAAPGTALYFAYGSNMCTGNLRQVAPSATPKSIVERLSREIAAGCKDAAFAARLEKIGVDPVCGTPAEFERAVRDDLALWKEAVQAAGIKPQ